MNWLLALLAFAGLMTVLSTVVTISVEGLHKLLSLRKSGLQEMLRALHDSVIVGIKDEGLTRTELQKANGGSDEAARFAKDMTKSPSYGGQGRWWWISNWNINLFQRQFERLTSRQFAEQLSQTEFGKALAEQPRSYIRDVLARSKYEFDRIGVAQSAYFRQRAKVISGIAAFVFVLAANVNLIDVYVHLSTNERTLNNTLALIGADDPELLKQRVEQIADDTRGIMADASADGLSIADTPMTAVEISDYVKALNAELRLPVGREYFPFCNPSDLVRPPKHCEGGQMPVYMRLLSKPIEGFVWLLSLIASAGLLALGAPFWFDLFSKTASLVGRAAASRVAAANTSGEPVRKAATMGKKAGPRDEEPELEELTDAFIIASGVPRTPLSSTTLIGQKLGAPSDQALSAGVPKRTMDAPPPPPTPDEEIPSEAKVIPGQADDYSPPAASGRLRNVRGVRGKWTRA
ncbi:MAG: hypothetical protein CMK09_07260 [Ponticaulis sp.]|nr:hypothetical protein [Ponticaulis sp.]|tara:strand:+ start:5407 stop:6795 length:1389 start_codon:yes stop_codon:yes gene_type:complete